MINNKLTKCSFCGYKTNSGCMVTPNSYYCKKATDEYYQYCLYTPKFEKAGINLVELVSVDANNNIVGFISYYSSELVPKEILGFTIMSFTNIPNLVFSKDLYKIVYRLLILENNNYINFKVIKGNPIEQTYKEFCNKFFEEGPVLSQKANRYRISREKLLQYIKR